MSAPGARGAKGDWSAGIEMGLTLAAAIADERTAKAIQLLLEYDPQPPFDCGSADTAPAEIITPMRAVREFIVNGTPDVGRRSPVDMPGVGHAP